MEIARKKEGRGNKVWMGYGKIRINEQWWKWDEEEEVLKDWRGIAKKEERGKDWRGIAKGGRRRGTEDWDRVRGKRGSGMRRERGGERGIGE